MKRRPSKPNNEAQTPDASDAAPIIELRIVQNEANRRRLAKVLARNVVRSVLEEVHEKHPHDPILKAEAARTEIPRISLKRVSKLEVMTAGELARYLEVPLRGSIITSSAERFRIAEWATSWSSRAARCSIGSPEMASCSGCDQLTAT